MRHSFTTINLSFGLNTPLESEKRLELAVIGGGISGLAAALKLREIAPDAELHVFEADVHPGGVLRTEEVDGYLVEHSADMFTTAQPMAMQLCERVGFDSELIEPNENHRRAFVVKRGRLLPVPDGLSLLGPSKIWPLVTTRLLSPLGKLRMVRERWVAKKGTNDDESLASFTKRRLGQEAFDWLIQPLISGIYTADPEKLSMRATLPQFLEMEQQYGSLMRGMRHKKKQSKADREASGARYGLFRAPRKGMSQFVRFLANRLPDQFLHCGVSVDNIERNNHTDRHNWRIRSGERQWDVDGLIVATPVNEAARLVAPHDQQLAESMRRIPLAGVAIGVLGVARSQLRRYVDGFGFVLPLRANRPIIAGSFANVKFAGRAPDGRILLRVFVGGACQAELLDLEDQEIKDLIWSELVDLLGAEGKPDFFQLHRWQDRMPQYHVGHVELVDEIERLTQPIQGLELAGNAYRGVGIPFCVRSGEQAAERLVQGLTRA